MRSSLLAPKLKAEQVVVDHKSKEDGHEVKIGGGNGLSNLELRLGISSDNGHGDGDAGLRSSRPWLGVAKGCYSSETGGGGGFVHPWSLAARQDQKAALEQQAQQRPIDCTVQREMRPPPPPLIGWPPVRTFRKNLGIVSNLAKPTDAEDCNKMKCTEGEESRRTETDTRPTMFVKVNLEGYAVGRKIDLKAHGSYDSLSRALQNMFHNFFSVDYSRAETKEDHIEQVESVPENYILLYEDNEGDRMLVGDVPWELFITSVKRLYIAHDPRVPKSG